MKKLEFPLLTADDIECRVGNVKDGKGFSLLLYKTARTDAKYLDQVVGAFNWQDKYYLLNDTLYCSIGIYCEERNEWVWKDDCGSETQVEKEKGQSSDAYKRAGFRWGIGRELYNSPFIWVEESKDNNKYARYEVKSIDYDNNREIKSLEIINSKTREVVFSFGVKKEKKSQEETLKEVVKEKTKATATMFDPNEKPQMISKENLGLMVKVYASYNEDRKARFMNWLQQEYHISKFEELSNEQAEEIILMCKMG